MENIVQSLNYSVQAIENFKNRFSDLAHLMPQSLPTIERVLALLAQSVKFILPNCADLIDRQALKEPYFDLLRLPYPLTALEIPWRPEKPTRVHVTGSNNAISSRRIILAWDESYADQTGLVEAVEPGIWFCILYYDDATANWLMHPLLTFIPRQNEAETVASIMEDSGAVENLFMSLMLEAGVIKAKSAGFTARYFTLLPELYAGLERRLGKQGAKTQALLDLRDEATALWQFCMTVNCVNIEHLDIPAPAALNKKRSKTGKLPLFSYKVLQLPLAPVASSKGEGGSGEGSRHSPRMHLRRGHPRRLQTGRVTYVRAAMVGTAQSGVIAKDYALPPRS